MSIFKATEFYIRQAPVTGKGFPLGAATFTNLRLPGDSVFTANITILNIIEGSRYWLAPIYSGVVDTANPLATGLVETAAAEGETTTITLSNIPAYENPQLFILRVRSASGTTKYIPYVTYGYLVKGGVSVYVEQVEDSVA